MLADRSRCGRPCPPAARARYLRRAAQAVLDEVDSLADALAAEARVPRTEAMVAELLPSVAGLHELADAGPKALRDQRLGRGPLRRSVLFQAPVGVVGVRGGDGSPWAEPVLEAAAALLAGNGVVLAGEHPALARRFVAALGRAGLPEELVCVDEDLTGCDRVVESGMVGPQAAMLVLDGAPLDRVVAGALQAAFARGGHGVASVGRIVTLPGTIEPLVQGVQAGARAIVVGDPRDPATELSAPAAPRVVRGEPEGAGPVLGVVEAPDAEAAIALCAGAPAVSVWGPDPAAAERVARVLDVELTWVNEHGDASVAAPVRIARHTRVRQLASRSVRLRYARWLPHDPTLVRAADTATRVLYGRESERLATIRTGGPAFVRAAARMVREQRRT